MSDTRRDELREKIRDIATGHGMRGRIPEFLEEELNEYEQLINGEVLAVLERLSVIANSKMYPNGIEDDIEQEKQNYAKQ